MSESLLRVWAKDQSSDILEAGAARPCIREQSLGVEKKNDSTALRPQSPNYGRTA